ncbi:hypothetical protein ACFS07_06130 [Undibacterium arcticum]
MQIKDIVSTADRACRDAKSGHHEGLVVYEKNAIAFSEREAELRLVERLSSSTATEGLFLEMQPIMSLTAPHESLNFEVLLRMRNYDGSVMPAGSIIAAAEKQRPHRRDRSLGAIDDLGLDRHPLRAPDAHAIRLHEFERCVAQR